MSAPGSNLPNRDGGSIETLLAPLSIVSPPAPAADAAVLIVLREREGDVETLLIERTIRTHDPASGQVALPGGRRETGDATLLDTALRELREEVGLHPADLSPPPRFVMTTEARAFGMRVAVFAAGLATQHGAPSIASPEEVAQVFWAPRRSLRSVERVPQATRFGRIEVDATIIDGHVLWGFTRRVLGTFFGVPMEDRVTAAGGQPPPDAPPSASDDGQSPPSWR